MTDQESSSNHFDKERTDMAEDRTVMAAERTFAGWMRTAFAAIGIGLAFHVMFGELEPPWLARAIATGFILLGAIIAFTAERRARRTLGRLTSHQADPPEIPSLSWMGWSVTAGAFLLAVALWLLRNG